MGVANLRFALLLSRLFMFMWSTMMPFGAAVSCLCIRIFVFLPKVYWVRSAYIVVAVKFYVPFAAVDAVKIGGVDYGVFAFC